MTRRPKPPKCNVVLDCGDTCQKPKGHAAPTHGCCMSEHEHGRPLTTNAPQLCQEHASALLASIRKLGLQAFVSPTLEERTRRYDLGSKQVTRDAYDPVLGAVGNFVVNLEGLSRKFMGPGEFEYVCPRIRCLLCFGQGLHDEYCPTGCGMKLDDWIDLAAGEQLKLAKSLGLVPSTLGLIGHAPS
jgi:hypothetical protein